MMTSRTWERFTGRGVAAFSMVTASEKEQPVASTVRYLSSSPSPATLRGAFKDTVTSPVSSLSTVSTITSSSSSSCRGAQPVSRSRQSRKSRSNRFTALAPFLFAASFFG